MKTRFAQLHDEIGCRGAWLAEVLGLSPEHVSRLRTGRVPMQRVTEIAMMALASGWRP